MAKALLMSGGVGGVSSDDVTARREHVLQGYATLTSDSNDEPVQGSMVNRGNMVDTVSFENAYWASKFLARMEQGFYLQNGQYKPCVAIPYEVLAQVVGVDRSKMLDTLTIAGKQGQIKSINTKDNNYRANKSTAYGIDWWSDTNNHVFWVDFPHGNGYYNRPDGHPHVCIDAINLGDVTADKVMRGFTATSKNGVKFAGTMPDLQSGRVVFNGATFDGDLLLGVASKSYSAINDTVAYQIGSGYGYSGVYNGGLNISLRTDSRVLLRRNVGFCFSHSVDMTPFNRVVIDYRSVGNISGNPSIEFVCFVTPIWHLARGAVIYDNQPIDKFNQISSSSIGVALNGQVTIDTRSLTGQCFVGCYAFVNISNSRDRYIGQLQITKIEFFN